MTTILNPEAMEKKADDVMESMGLKDYDELFDSSIQEVRAEVRDGLKEHKSVDTSAALDL